MQAQSKVTICIINYNGYADTLECLQSILESEYEKFEVLVLDNGSSPDQTGLLKKSIVSKKIKIIRSEKNLGFAGGNNKLIDESESELVILLNNDTTVQSDWLEPLISLIDQDQNIAAIQPKIKSYLHKEFFEYAGAAGGYIDKLGFPYAKGRIGFHIEKDEGQYDEVSDIFWASGSCILLRKSALKKVGLLPDEFFFYHEETDLCWRLKNAGYNIKYQPKSVIFHKGSGSSKNIFPKKIYYVHRNNLILIARNAPISKLFKILPLRLATDFLSCLYYFYNGQIVYVASVIMANIYFYKNIKNILTNRPKLNSQSSIVYKSIKPKSIFVNYFILNKKRFSDIFPENKKTELMKYKELLPENVIKNIRQNTISLFFNPIMMLIAIGLVTGVVWFHSGLVIAAGEEALSFYNPQKTLSIYSTVWYPAGTGYPMPVLLPRIPIFALAALFSTLLPAAISQAIIFTLMMIIALLGTYLFAERVTNDKPIALTAGLFYLYNLYSQSQIWQRNLFTGISTWALLPIFLYYWAVLLDKFTVSKFSQYLCISIILSFAFGQPADIFVIWIPTFLYFLFSLRENILDKIRKAALYFGSWVVINLYWLIPYVKLGGSAFESVSGTENFDSLRGVSTYFPLDTILLLRQKFFFTKEYFSGFYLQEWVIASSVLIFILSIVGIISSKKIKYWNYLFISFLVALFICKGSNPPFGSEFYHWLFSSIPQTQALRNPYEKYGTALLIPYSIFFSLGLFYIVRKINIIPLKSILFMGMFILTCVVLPWPMWRGRVYASSKINVYVKVPQDYSEINQIINQNKNDIRILMLPPNYGDGVHYNWETGSYSGLEPSEFLFDKQALSKNLRTKYFDNKYKDLLDSYGSHNFIKNLDETNIKYIVMHKDVSGFSSKEHQQLLSYNNIIEIKETEHLILFENGNLSSENKFRIDQNSQVEFTTLKKSNTNYLINISKATESFTLEFLETYSDHWEATINTQKLEHRIVYNYANEWLVPKTGTFQINIRFKL